MKKQKTVRKPSALMMTFLNFIEKVGNMLPHPATLFLSLSLLIILVSALTSYLGVEATNPANNELVKPNNLLSVEGFQRIISSMVRNFTGFVPLGTVLVAMLGMGIAEGTGFIASALKLLVGSAPKKLLTFTIVLAGVLSNTASEVGYVLIIPLAAIAFKSAGRNPLAGVAAGFAGVSGGYSANLLLSTVDPLLAGLSEEAARILRPEYVVNPTANYYFMAASTFIIAITVTLITEKIIVPKLGKYKETEEDAEKEDEDIRKLTALEKRGLIFSFVTFIALTALIVAGTVPETGFLRDLDTGSLIRSPFMSGIVAIIFIVAASLGISYGIGAGSISSDVDVMKGMSRAMENLGSYIVMVFFAAQFVAYFNWSNLGIIIAINGASFLNYLGLGQIPLILGMVVLAAFINLFIGSASAKWAVLAPVFVPMFMLLGYSPELTQVAYRIGDSCTNIISPMLVYFPFIVCIMQRYKKNAGIGTLVSTMLPYTIGLMIVWSIMLIAWVLLGLDLGPGAGLLI